MTTGRNLTNSVIQIGQFKADDRLRVGGILYLEEKLGKGFEEIADDMSKALSTDKVHISKMVGIMSLILMALILQRNTEIDEADAEQALMRLELEEFTAVFDKLKLFEAKNAPGPLFARHRRNAHGSRSRNRLADFVS